MCKSPAPWRDIEKMMDANFKTAARAAAFGPKMRRCRRRRRVAGP
jgi:hypothetical protein